MVSSSQQSTRKLRVGFLFGGRSGEHEVSLSSASGIMQAVDKQKYEIVPIGITKEGCWFRGGDPMQTLSKGAGIEALRPMTVQLETKDAGQAEQGRETRSPDLDLSDLDVVFPVLHGPFGEDGTIQGFLEMLGLPFVGAGVAASAVGMDKAICKHVFLANDLPILPYRVFLRKQWQDNTEQVVAECEAYLDYPMFTKPVNMGSSVGISKVTNREELAAGLELAARFDRKLVVEQGIEAREIEISVLGNDDPIISVPGEIIPSREFYSYAAKYLDDASDLLIPAPISEEQAKQVRQIALRAYAATDCSGMARVDFLIDRKSGKVWLNELNTIPGFTPISMYPKLWEQSGIGYSELIDRLIQLAVERYEDKKSSATSFDVSTAT